MDIPQEACCPHARGGEPLRGAGLDLLIVVVPTPVGVNRRTSSNSFAISAVVPTPVGVNPIFSPS